MTANADMTPDDGERRHLPECSKSIIPDFYNERWVCICAPLRACEQRVRMEDDDYAYVAAQAEADGRRRAYHGQRGYEIGYRKGLAAAQEVVSWVQDIDDALDAIKALVDMDDSWDSSGMPDPPPLPPSTGVPTNPMWPLRKERK